MKNDRRNPILRIGAAVILLAGFLLWYGVCVEPNRLAVYHYTLDASASVGHRQADAASLRLVQISDLQMGDHYSIRQLQRVVRRMNNEKPDVIVFHGDLFEDFRAHGAALEQDVVDCLRQLQAPLGKYAIWGNRDYGGGAARAYKRTMRQAGFTLLCNDSTVIPLKNGKSVLLCGLDDGLFGKPDGSNFFQQEDDTCVYRILLLHEPDLAQLWTHASFQLILAGHSHGGQVRLPFCPGFQTAMARQYTRHFYTLNPETGLLLYVNTGLGTSHFAVRIGVPPEIAVFEIKV